MKCTFPECDGDLKVTRTYGNDAGKTSTGQCAKCNRRYTLVTLVLNEDTKSGEGAFAAQKRLDDIARKLK